MTAHTNQAVPLMRVDYTLLVAALRKARPFVEVEVAMRSHGPASDYLRYAVELLAEIDAVLAKVGGR